MPSRPFTRQTRRIKRNPLVEALLAYHDFRFAVTDLCGFAECHAASRERMAAELRANGLLTDKVIADEIQKDADKIRTKVKRVKELLAEFKPSDRTMEEVFNA